MQRADVRAWLGEGLIYNGKSLLRLCLYELLMIVQIEEIVDKQILLLLILLLLLLISLAGAIFVVVRILVTIFDVTFIWVRARRGRL